MSNTVSEHLIDRVTIRSYREEDRPAVARLYTDGLIAGQLASNDTGADIENIHEAYFNEASNHFWVAQSEGQVIAMIGLARDEGPTAEIRRLRVEKDWQNTPLAEKLVQTALQHCRHHGYLKVVLDTRVEPGKAQELFEKAGFHHTRTKSVQSKDLLEFYLDLYRAPKKEGE
jgi:N-acetylglutamate synthase-like GNAT family acetyltransferase